MGPFFCHKIRVVGHHVHESGLGVLTRIKNVIKFQQGRSRSWLDNRGRYNKEMDQSKENDNIFNKDEKGNEWFWMMLETQMDIQNNEPMEKWSLTHFPHYLFGKFCLWKQYHKKPKRLRAKCGERESRMDRLGWYTDNIHDGVQSRIIDVRSSLNLSGWYKWLSTWCWNQGWESSYISRTPECERRFGMQRMTSAVGGRKSWRFKR